MSTPERTAAALMPLTALDHAITFELADGAARTARELAAELGVLQAEITYRCARLTEAGILVYDGICYRLAVQP